MIVPFKGRTKPASYTGASSPNSEGRMPKRMTEAPLKEQGESASTWFENKPAPPVDGSIRGHDTNYPREPKESLDY